MIELEIVVKIENKKDLEDLHEWCSKHVPGCREYKYYEVLLKRYNIIYIHVSTNELNYMPSFTTDFILGKITGARWYKYYLNLDTMTFNEFKNKYMETKRTIEISLETAKEWYKSNNTSLKEIALQAFSKEELDPEITYERICNELFKENETFYYTNSNGQIRQSMDGMEYSYSIYEPNSAFSRKQLEKLLAINKLMTVAKYLNRDKSFYLKYYIYINCDDKLEIGSRVTASGSVFFISVEAVRQAIKILGEDTIRLALSTDC